MSQLAEFNIARTLAPLDDPVMGEFVENLDSINDLAEKSDGFVWRLMDEVSGNATGISVFDDPNMIVNLSVWQDVESLKNYVYRSRHSSFLKRRMEWFDPMRQPWFVMWWIRTGHIPSLEEARQRLEHFRENGNTSHAFNLSGSFPAPEVSAQEAGS